jgi:hypothetical protein
MKLKKWITWCVFVGIGVLAVSAAEAKTFKFNGTTSGSALSTEIDTNADNIKASLNSGGGKSTLGAFTFQSLTEYAVSGPATCPNGQSGTVFSLVPGSGHTVFRFPTDDLLFSQYTNATLCFVDNPDPLPDMFFVTSGDAEIIGGTGKYTNATGSFQLTGGVARRLFIAPSPSGNRTFNATTAEFSGTVVLQSQ